MLIGDSFIAIELLDANKIELDLLKDQNELVENDTDNEDKDVEKQVIYFQQEKVSLTQQKESFRGSFESGK